MNERMHIGRLRLIFLMAGAVALLAPAARCGDAPSADRAVIAKKGAAFVEAFQKGDAEAVAAFWAPDGDYVHLSGRTITGRKAIAKEFADLFAESKGLTVRVELSSIRFPTPDTAIEDGVTTVSGPEGGIPSRARYTNFLVKRDGEWLIESVREAPYEPPSHYEHLRPLEWTIGEWVQDTKEPHVARVMFEWTPDQNFILVTRAVGIKEALLDNGTQRVGWDPAGKMIRSWTFEADGGFAHASWKQEGDKKWVVTTSSVLRSGSLMTSTTVVTRVNNDTVTWQAKDQVLDGKPLPDTAVVTMKRVK